MSIDKIIVSNKSVLKQKYGKNFTKLEAALKKLVAHDKTNGIVSKLIWLDDSTSMKPFSAPVVKVADQSSLVKKAIDALAKKIKPDYFLIVGAPDVIPHCELENLIFTEDSDDDDDIVPSDLPYACNSKLSAKISDFVAPNRVLGRLPDIAGSSDHTYLLNLISNITTQKPKEAKEYLNYFALSNESWSLSSEESVKNMFSDTTKLKLVPLKIAGFTKKELSALIHFYNCHGSSDYPAFTGEAANGDQHDCFFAKYLKKKVATATVVAVECCYGAQLYDPGFAEVAPSICNTYLGEGAAGYMGSTTIAYGPAAGQGLADLITQYFIRNVLKGMSLGRAFLDAQLRFVEKCGKRIDPHELKTLGQFLLLGDPSQHLVKIATAVSKIDGKSISSKSIQLKRKDRREKLVSWAKSVDETTWRPFATVDAPKVKTIVRAAVREKKFDDGSHLTFKFKTKTGLHEPAPDAVCHVFFTRKAVEKKRFPLCEARVITEEAGEILDVKNYVRK
ncbi:MAG: hypothetical protein SH856_00480 [Flavobacteriales bacterium]|nr:hypothetical protein [Flavobacteriales bacterium]